MGTVILHSLQQAEYAVAAAVADGKPITLLTAPGAAAYGGPGYYLAMVEAARARHPEAMVTAILDCGDDAALAQMAFSLGWRHVVLAGPAAVREKLQQIARHYGAVVMATPPKATDLGADQ
jgi:hypothetical protein